MKTTFTRGFSINKYTFSIADVLKATERGTLGSSLFHKSPGQRGSRSRTHVRARVPPSIYDVLSFLSDLCPWVPLLTSSPRQLVQALRLSAAPQRPPNPATLLTLRVKSPGERYFRNGCWPARGLVGSPNLRFFCVEKNAAFISRVSGEIDKESVILTPCALINFCCEVVHELSCYFHPQIYL